MLVWIIIMSLFSVCYAASAWLFPRPGNMASDRWYDRIGSLICILLVSLGWYIIIVNPQ